MHDDTEKQLADFAAKVEKNYEAFYGPRALRRIEPRPAVARSLWLVVVCRLREWWRIRRIKKMASDARRRMNSYTPEQRAELYRRAMETIDGAKPTDNIPVRHEGAQPRSCL